MACFNNLRVISISNIIEGKLAKTKRYDIKFVLEKCNIHWNRFLVMMKKIHVYLVHQQEKRGFFLDTEYNTFTNLVFAMIMFQVFVLQNVMKLVLILIPMVQMTIHILRYVFDQVLAISSTPTNDMKLKKFFLTLIQIKILYEISLFAYCMLLKPIWTVCYLITNPVYNTLF